MQKSLIAEDLGLTKKSSHMGAFFCTPISMASTFFTRYYTWQIWAIFCTLIIIKLKKLNNKVLWTNIIANYLEKWEFSQHTVKAKKSSHMAKNFIAFQFQRKITFFVFFQCRGMRIDYIRKKNDFVSSLRLQKTRSVLFSPLLEFIYSCSNFYTLPHYNFFYLSTIVKPWEK